MLIFKITEVKFCMSLRIYHDVTLSAKDAVAFTPYLRPNRKLNWTVILLKNSKIDLKVMYIKKYKNETF